MVVKTDRNTEFWMNVTKQRIKKLFPNNLFLNKRISGFEILSKHLIIKCMLLQGNNFIVLKQQHKWCIFYELKSVHHSTERVCYCFYRVGHDDIIIFIWFFFLEILRALIDSPVIDVIISHYLFYSPVLNVNKLKGGSIRSIFNVSTCCFDAFDPNGEDWAAGVDLHFND